MNDLVLYSGIMKLFCQLSPQGRLRVMAGLKITEGDMKLEIMNKETILGLIEIIEEQQELIGHLLAERHTKDQAARGAMVASFKRISAKIVKVKKIHELGIEFPHEKVVSVEG